MSALLPAGSTAADRSSNLPAFFDVARQHGELLTWVGTRIQEHEQRIEELTQEVKVLAQRQEDSESRSPRATRSGRSSSQESPRPRGDSFHHTESAGSFAPKKWEPHKDHPNDSNKAGHKSPGHDTHHAKAKNKVKGKDRSKSGTDFSDGDAGDVLDGADNETESAPVADDEEAAAQKLADDEAAAQKQAEEEAAALKKAEDEAIAKKKAEEEALAKQKKDEEEVAKVRRTQGQDAANKLAEKQAAAAKKAEEEAAVAAAKKAEEEAAVAAAKEEEEEAAAAAKKAKLRRNAEAEAPREFQQEEEEANESAGLEDGSSAEGKAHKSDSSPTDLRDSPHGARHRPDTAETSYTADDSRSGPQRSGYSNSEVDGGIDDDDAWKADLDQYALTSDVDNKFSEFSDYVQGELERLDDTISQDMEARIQEALATAIQQGVQDAMAQKFATFAEDMESLVGDKIASSIPNIVGQAALGLDFSDAGGVAMTTGESFADPFAAMGAMAPQTSHSTPGESFVDPFAAVVAIAPETSNSTTETPAEDNRTQRSEDAPVPQQVAQDDPILGPDAVDVAAEVPNDVPVAAGSEQRPGSGGAMVSGLAPGIVASGSPSSAVAPVVVPSQQSPASAPVAPSNDQVIQVVRRLDAEINALKRRLPPVEGTIKELSKKLHVDMPSMQNDLESLMAQMGQAAPVTTTSAENVKRDASPDIGGDSDDDNGAGAGAHAAESPRMLPSQTEVKDRVKRAKASEVAKAAEVEPLPMQSMMSSYMSGGHQCAVDKDMFEALKARVDRVEEDHGAVEKFEDVEQLVSILEDRVKELDQEYRSHKKLVTFKLDLHDREDVKEAKSASRVYEAWDLDRQVEVIQSVVAIEMRAVRHDVDRQINQAKVGCKSFGDESSLPARSRSKSGVDETEETETWRIEENEEKVKRLQNAYQQAQLMMAGLKSASRHTEQQVHQCMEQMRRVKEEVEDAAGRAMKNETRLDYLAVHYYTGNKDECGEEGEKSSSFAGAVAATNGTKNAAKSVPIAATPEKPPVGRGVPGRKRASMATGPDAPGAKAGGLQHANTQKSLVSDTPGRLEHSTTSGNVGQAGSLASEQDDINTGRIWRMGKKLNDLDGDTHAQFLRLAKEVELLNERTNMVVSFLPKKLRRMVEKLLSLSKKEDDEDRDDWKKDDSKNPKKHVVFSEKAPDVRTFNVEAEKDKVPWQYMGEPDQKWAWCLQPRNDMGRDLARYFEQLEEEREEGLANFLNEIDRLRQEMQNQQKYAQMMYPDVEETPVGSAPPSPMHGKVDSRVQSVDFTHEVHGHAQRALHAHQKTLEWGPSGGNAFDITSHKGGFGSSEGEKLQRQMQKVVLPQIQTLEDRIDRIVKDLFDVRKLQDSDHVKKADKEEIQLIRMRLEPFEKFDPRQVAAKLENLEVDGKHTLHLTDQLAEQIRKIQEYAANRADVVKVRAEVTGIKTDVQKLKGEQKETASTIFHSNRQISNSVLETKTNVEKAITKLEVEKVPVTEYVVLQEIVHKLNNSMTNNRQILTDSGAGAEVSAIVKRIILNMEDKIMLLEKKMEAILEASEGTKGKPAIDHGFGKASPYEPGHEESGAFVQDALLEFTTISQAVQQLKQEVTMSKVSMDHIREQGIQATEMAQRLNIIIDDGDATTTLSLGRVQIMVAAAARQLVAGSKWVTQEIFDVRLIELKKEFHGFVREVQVQIEEVVQVPRQLYANAGPKKPLRELPNLPRKVFTDHDADGGWDAAFGAAGTRLGIAQRADVNKGRPNTVGTLSSAKSPLTGTMQQPPNSARGSTRPTPGSARGSNR